MTTKKEQMLELMAGNKKAIKKFMPKEEKPKNDSGKFIVKTHCGYITNGTLLCAYISQAKVFNSYKEAKEVADKWHGKVVAK